MRLVKPSYKIEKIMADDHSLLIIERAGRTCYKSEDMIFDDTAIKFAKMIMASKHESVIEHSAMTVRFICNRGFTHELVRHRLASYSQESTRYCNYKGGVTFIIPPWCSNLDPGDYNEPIRDNLTTYDERVWQKHMLDCESTYIHLLNACGWSPQQARGVLPIDIKTEIVMTTNFREWRHIFKLRTAKAAHPQMRELMIPLLNECKTLIPVIFDDINYE